MIFQSGYRSPLVNLVASLGTFLLTVLKHLVLLFAKPVGGLLYLLLLILTELLSYLFSFCNPPAFCLECQHHHQSHEKEKDKPLGCVTIEICNSDEISDLDLNDLTAEHGLHRMRHPHGSWEHRHIHYISPEDIKRRVLPWLERIVEERVRSDSGYTSQEEVSVE